MNPAVNTGCMPDNDTDADSDPLTEIKVSDHSNGSVSLISDGTFTIHFHLQRNLVF